jgi:hypothetical protein
MYLESMLTPSPFFEAIESYDYDKKWHALASQIAGDAYSEIRWSFWLQMNPRDQELSGQGFKLHVSPDFQNLDSS